MEKATTIQGNQFWNQDCITGAQEHLANGSVDLLIADPPYGIDGANLGKHYNRNESFVVDGYVEVPESEYANFSDQWIAEAARVLKPGGSLFIISGYTNLRHVLNALADTSLIEVNHIIWKYNFGVYTKKKFVSSHYHILYYVKPGGTPTFHLESRYGSVERDESNGSLNYQDREDVWVINRDYKPGESKNQNQLPVELVQKIMQYASSEGHIVSDFFLGGFTTAAVAIGLNRNFVGFELSKGVFQEGIRKMKSLRVGWLKPSLRQPVIELLPNQGKPWTDEEKEQVQEEFARLLDNGQTKKGAIHTIGQSYGRGPWSIQRVLRGN